MRYSVAREPAPKRAKGATARVHGERSETMNELCWVTLQVADLENARHFWREIIGFPEKRAHPGWVELELRPDLLLALHPTFYAKALEKRGYDRGGPVMG